MTQQKVPHKHADNSASTRVPHIHAELIKQWADGATIQYKPHNNLHDWKDADESLESIGWHTWCDYRIKPEPKPDVVLYAMIAKEKDPFDNGVKIVGVRANQQLLSTDTCMFVFDGETGKLKDCQVLAKE